MVWLARGSWIYLGASLPSTSNPNISNRLHRWRTQSVTVMYSPADLRTWPRSAMRVAFLAHAARQMRAQRSTPPPCRPPGRHTRAAVRAAALTASPCAARRAPRRLCAVTSRAARDRGHGACARVSGNAKLRGDEPSRMWRRAWGVCACACEPARRRADLHREAALLVGAELDEPAHVHVHVAMCMCHVHMHVHGHRWRRARRTWRGARRRRGP